jgi:hypothetical protein
MGNPAIEISKYVKLRNKLNNLIDDTEWNLDFMNKTQYFSYEFLP